ncbi:MAG: hypothetical protein KME13_02710 [Myxacorys californica WJT36-NPBG1]|jgi:hypothetical protein|nr:hypothetical protein [Myxacorys californica WJT36-NPBG1]
MSQLTSSWHFDLQESYVPVSHNGSTVGFCKPNYAKHIVNQLSELERVQKALHQACYDLIARTGGNSDVSEMVQRYLNNAERPLAGTAMIASLLKQRQQNLDLNNDEFAKFCDSYRLSIPELRAIYAGEEIESYQLSPLSRILGTTIDDLIAAWKGE